MLKYILRRLGYGHQLDEVENTSTAIDYPVLHTVIPNYATLVNVEQMYDFDISKPVHELLPFTATEYIVAGFINIITTKMINIKPSNENLKEKFISKRLVNIPHYPMGSLEFINMLHTNLDILKRNSNFTPYILLTHDDVLLNSATSYNFNKSLQTLSVPLEILDSISELKLLCDFKTKEGDELYFSFTFNKVNSEWVLLKMTSTHALTHVTPFELFVGAWEMLLLDIDHLCNRKPLRIKKTNVVNYVHFYNMRAKYDIGDALLNIAKIIDIEIDRVENGSTHIQTAINDSGLGLSSHHSDFRSALMMLKASGSKLEIIV